MKLFTLALYAISLLCAHANAAAPVAAPTQTTVTAPGLTKFGQLDLLRSENAILAEKLKNAEMKLKISTGSATPQSGNPFLNGPSMPALSPMAPRSSLEATQPRPPVQTPAPSALVHMVSGIGTDLTAVISLANGSKVISKVGSKIDGVGEIRKVTTNEVIAFQKNRSYAIPFAGEKSGSSNDKVEFIPPPTVYIAPPTSPAGTK